MNSGLMGFGRGLVREEFGRPLRILRTANAEEWLPAELGLLIQNAQIGAYDMPAYISASSRLSVPRLENVMIPAHWAWRRRALLPQDGSARQNFGMNPTITGTVTHPVPAMGSVQSTMHRMQVASSATAGNAAAIYPAISNDRYFWRGDGAGRGGFVIFQRFTLSLVVAQSRAFFGLYGTAGNLANGNPSALLNLIGVGFDSAETVWSTMVNDGAGAATKVALPLAPVNNTDVFELMIACTPGGEPWMMLVNLTTGKVALKWTRFAENIPALNQFLGAVMWHNNGTTASAVQFQFGMFYTFAPY